MKENAEQMPSRMTWPWLEEDGGSYKTVAAINSVSLPNKSSVKTLVANAKARMLQPKVPGVALMELENRLKLKGFHIRQDASPQTPDSKTNERDRKTFCYTV